ncbi:hypothetical protein [Streptomyces fuscigenes]|uniref:hypothetical protein n=1 Tax=Streptomyces fuscigenes TaxID=1528880 RepID=UPI001F338797|nr:hypothetical protein [Streptomyces fuscigenes]MCF3960322.1 hypothetical protein [Streptomyces fuscigenes]
MSETTMEAAVAALRAADTHTLTCTTCPPGARLGELCPDGQAAATSAAASVDPDLVQLSPGCAHTSWEVTSEYPTAGGFKKSRRCADCTESLDAIVEPEPHWPDRTPAALRARDTTGAARALDPAGPARLAALMRTRQHWREDRLVSEGRVSQSEIRDALGWSEPDHAPTITWTPGRLDRIRDIVSVIAAGPTAFPDLTDEFVIRNARALLPELLGVVDLLAARVEELEARGCRCYDATTHAPGCVKASVRWQGRTVQAAVWHSDRDGDWWLPVALDYRGCPLVLLNGDTSNDPVPLDQLEADYGRLAPSQHGTGVPRTDLPEAERAHA